MSVIVLHGFTGDGSTMRALADLVDPTAIVPDLAGHGAGPHSTDPADYTVDAMADAVLAIAGDWCDLVGYSMGGRVALTAACRHPERVRSLTLIGASAGLADPDHHEPDLVAGLGAHRGGLEELANGIDTFSDNLGRWRGPWVAAEVDLGQMAQSNKVGSGDVGELVVVQLQFPCGGRQSPPECFGTGLVQFVVSQVQRWPAKVSQMSGDRLRRSGLK